MRKGKEPNFYYVYIITNLILNKKYVGSRMCYKDNIEEDNYWGSSKYLDEDYKIHGKENFIKKILQCDYTNKDDMLNGETNYILEYNTLEPNGYNRYLPNQRKRFHGSDVKCSKEHADKIRKSLTGVKRPPRPEKTKEKIRKSLTGVKHPKERCEKNRLAHTGLTHKEETKEKIKKSHIGLKQSKETCDKISKALKRKPKSEEHKQKLSKSLTGRKQSEETKRKKSKSLLLTYQKIIKKSFYQNWIEKFGKEIADLKLEQWKEKHRKKN